MKQALLIIIVLVFGGGIIYSRFFKPTTPLPDVSIYERRIDSLNAEIELHNKKVLQLDSLVDVQKTKITKLENKLSKTAAEAAKEQKEHEEDLKRINAMSNSDVAALFTESFK